MSEKKFIIGDEAGQRIDVFLAGESGLSRSFISKLIAEGHVLVSGKKIRSGYKIKKGEVVFMRLPEIKDTGLKPYKKKIDIVYEDEYLIVVNKEAGVVVHPGAGEAHKRDSLVNMVLYHCGENISGIGGIRRPGIVHRLDKDTSGLIVIAKSDVAHKSLSDQFKDRKVHKVYMALVSGNIKHKTGKIISPIGRDRRDRKKMAVTAGAGGKEAISRYELVEQYEGFALLKITIHSGRTHQIRVHFAAIGHPVAGDSVYGNAKSNSIIKEKCGLSRQFLHAAELSFAHPVTGKTISKKSGLPADLQAVIECLEGK